MQINYTPYRNATYQSDQPDVYNFSSYWPSPAEQYYQQHIPAVTSASEFGTSGMILHSQLAYPSDVFDRYNGAQSLSSFYYNPVHHDSTNDRSHGVQPAESFFGDFYPPNDNGFTNNRNYDHYDYYRGEHLEAEQCRKNAGSFPRNIGSPHYTTADSYPNCGFSRLTSQSSGPDSSRRDKEQYAPASPHSIDHETVRPVLRRNSDWARYSAVGVKNRHCRSNNGIVGVGNAWDKNSKNRCIQMKKSEDVEICPSGSRFSSGASSVFDDDGKSVRFVKPSSISQGANRMSKTYRVDPPLPGPPAPPSQPLPCSLLEAILLLRVSDQRKLPRNRRALDFALCGAVVMDLYMNKKIEPHPNSIRYPAELKVRLLNSTPTNDEYSNRVLQKMTQRQNVCSLTDVINDLFSSFRNIAESALNRLIRVGWLNYQEGVGGKSAEYPVVNVTLHTHLRQRVVELMRINEEGEQPPVMDAVLATLYWLPKDWTDWTFGNTLATYEAKQLSKAVIYAVHCGMDAVTDW